MAKKKQKAPPKVDGEIGPDEIKRIRQALRQVWQWTSVARRNCLKRAALSHEMSFCESCFEIVGKVYADHIEVMGSPLAPDYIKRLWCHSSHLQALCKKCHDKKTREEKKLTGL